MVQTLKPEPIIEENMGIIFQYYSLKNKAKKSQLFVEHSNQMTYLTLHSYLLFCNQILAKVLEIPKSKLVEIFKKCC